MFCCYRNPAILSSILCAVCTPGAISNGRIVDGQAPYVLGDLISWQCDTGYRMAGARVSRCLGSGVFDTFPSCEGMHFSVEQMHGIVHAQVLV